MEPVWRGWTAYARLFVLIILCGLLAGCKVYDSPEENPEAAGAEETTEMGGDDADGMAKGQSPESFGPALNATDKMFPLKNPRVVVDKSENTIYVYDGKTLYKKYRVYTGEAAGDKVKVSDMRTPEGTFYICTRNDKSRYYLSLGLSYPGVEDAKRGLANGWISKKQYEQIVTAHKNKTQPSWRTKLGGSIMIHGEMQKGRTSTNGCVALRDNNDMKELWNLLPMGTEVVVKP